jgi:predicted DNA-binding transcriptional regulator AlpA
MAQELISVRECARRIGVSDTAIHKAIKDGRISVAAHHPKSGWPQMDFEDVLAKWHSNTDPAMQRSSPDGGNGRMKAGAKVAAGATSARTAPDQPTDSYDREPIPPYNESRAMKEAYAAKSAKLDFEEKSGALVSREQVKAEEFAIARRVRDAILNVADRIDAELAAVTDAREINLRLKRELTQAMAALADEAQNGS